jgi:hypothetical protein
LTGLVKKLDERLNDDAPKLPNGVRNGTYVVFNSNKDGLDKDLRKTVEKEGLKHVSFCIGDVPKEYEVNWSADVTVVIYSRNAVVANFALKAEDLDPDMTSKIADALSQVVSPK